MRRALRLIVLPGKVPCRTNVMRPGFGKDVFGLRNLSPVITMNGDQDVTRVNLDFVDFGFEFWNANADQPADDAANGGAAQGRDNRTRGDEWAYSRNNHRADAGEPPQSPSQASVRANANFPEEVP